MSSAFAAIWPTVMPRRAPGTKGRQAPGPFFEVAPFRQVEGLLCGAHILSPCCCEATSTLQEVGVDGGRPVMLSKGRLSPQCGQRS